MRQRSDVTTEGDAVSLVDASVGEVARKPRVVGDGEVATSNGTIAGYRTPREREERQGAWLIRLGNVGQFVIVAVAVEVRV